jgi:hypothetical protein
VQPLQFAILVIVESGFFLCYILFLHIKEDNSSVMCTNIHAMPELPTIQYQQLLSLHWHSFSECCSEHVAVVFAPRGCQYLINGCLQPIGTCITQDVMLTMIDTLFLNRVVIVLQSILPIKAANTSVMHNSDQLTVQLLYLPDQKSLMLRWCSFQKLAVTV